MTDFKYTRIISYGCSFTAGSEIADHEVIGVPEEELLVTIRKNNITESREVYNHYNLDRESRRKILFLNRSRSWPNYIAQYYNIPLLNQAVPGSSLSHATYCLLRDIHNNIILPTDLILIGITSPNRWFQFSENGEPSYGVFSDGWAERKHTLLPKQYREELQNNWYNLYNVMYTHCKEIQFLSNLSNAMGKQIKLCYAIGTPTFIQHLFPKELPLNFIRQFLPNNKENSENTTGSSTFFEFCQRLVSTENILSPNTSLAQITPRIGFQNHHAFGHPRIEFHKQFASILLEDLEKK